MLIAEHRIWYNHLICKRWLRAELLIKMHEASKMKCKHMKTCRPVYEDEFVGMAMYGELADNTRE